ncbi:hypothetical protein TUM17560_32530 [Serratia marcescens]|jgi:hypothetical protein|nr:hypothetical protein TUM17560_32530 [Serratia marcescens]
MFQIISITKTGDPIKSQRNDIDLFSILYDISTNEKKCNSRPSRLIALFKTPIGKILSLLG